MICIVLLYLLTSPHFYLQMLRNLFHPQLSFICIDVLLIVTFLPGFREFNLLIHPSNCTNWSALCHFQ